MFFTKSIERQDIEEFMKKTFLILLISTSVFAQNANLNLNKTLFGQHISAITARSLSMGGAGLANGNAFLASSHNPALAVNSDGQIAFNTGFRLQNIEEDRAFLYRDNFEGYVDYGSYYFQNNWYASMYGQVVYAPGIEGLMDLHISTGYIPFTDFNYDYFEEVRSSGYGDELLAYNIIENEGELSAIRFNLAIRPMEHLSIGIGVNLLLGDVVYNERIVPKSIDLADVERSIKIDNELDGSPIVTNFGSSFIVNERLTIAATYRLPFTIKTKAKLTQTTVDTSISLSSNREVDYPARVGFGLDYRFENILAAQIMIDYYYEFWSDFEDSWSDNLNFEDTYNFRVGIEHLFFDDIPFRAGFSFGTLREDKSLTETILSLGTGFNFKGVQFDFAAGYSNYKFTQNDLYDNGDYGETTRTDSDRVNWTQIFARIDFSYSFK